MKVVICFRFAFQILIYRTYATEKLIGIDRLMQIRDRQRALAAIVLRYVIFKMANNCPA